MRLRVLLQLIGPAPAGTATRGIASPGEISFTVDGSPVTVPDDGTSLLDVLRDQLGITSAKDGCAPQGQCGCCTVWVDGAARVACVTPARRVAGRAVTTLDGLPADQRERWISAFVDAGASQCGFCTPGIVMRLTGLECKRPDFGDAEVRTSLAAHLCRCTGWEPIVDAARLARLAGRDQPAGLDRTARGTAGTGTERDLSAAAQRATLESGTQQSVGPDVVAGRAGFADDTAPRHALVAVPDGKGGWVVDSCLAAARRRAGKVQGRNTTLTARHPVAVPGGDFAFTLQTTFVEPAYLEPDASWCAPDGDPATPLANGGAFGAKLSSPVVEAARSLAASEGRAVRVLFAREDTIRLGPKRPPIAAGVRPDGSVVLRVGRTPGSADLAPWRQAVHGVLPGAEIEEVEVPGPPVSHTVRGAGWAEAAVLRGAWAAWRAGGGSVVPATPVTVTSAQGARATAIVGPGFVSVSVAAGEVLDEVVLRSYVTGAVHQALGWVRREGVAVDESGAVMDLTVRSLGIIPAREMPEVRVVVEDAPGPAVRAGDAVLAAVAAAAWIEAGLAPSWPVEGGGRR
ncbi:MAG: 2Fe-2S iron-sulfur cluster-binding protein [Acidimicrobiales bacterium]